jgi:hypothetical protein
MRRNALKALGAVAAAACLATASCRRLDVCPREAAPKARAAAAAVQPAKPTAVAAADAIPAEYGKAIGVTQDPSRPQSARLWFQRQDGAIVVVSVDVEQGKVQDEVLTIPRR